MSEYTWWRNALKGNFGPIHGNDPQSGFYRRRYGNKLKGETLRWEPVAIWYSGGEGKIVACEGMQAKRKVVDAEDVWTYCCRYPITDAVYNHAVATGKWLDDIEDDVPPPIGDNNPPAEEAAADEVTSAVRAAIAALNKGPVKTQVECDILANHRDRLLKLWKVKDEERKEEKRPHDEAADAVNEKFKPILAQIKATGEMIRDAMTAFMVAEQARQEEEAKARKAQFEAPVEVKKPKAGTVGHVSGLRTHRTVIVEDYAALLAHFARHESIIAEVTRLANAYLKATKEAPPGCKIKEEKRAA